MKRDHLSNVTTTTSYYVERKGPLNRIFWIY